MALDSPTTGIANPAAYGNSFKALDIVAQRTIGNGVLSGLSVDSTGTVQIGEALIGHVVALTSPTSVAALCAPSSLNYVYIVAPASPIYPGSDGRDIGTIVVNQTGITPTAGALLGTVLTDTGSPPSVTSVNTAPAGRNQVVPPATVQAKLSLLQNKSGFVPGAIVVGPSILAWRIPVPLTLLQLKAEVLSAPGGAAMVIDVKKNGTSVFSTTGARLSMAAGSTAGASGTCDNGASCVEGDLVTFDITAAGTTPAQGLMLTLYYQS